MGLSFQFTGIICIHSFPSTAIPTVLVNSLLWSGIKFMASDFSSSFPLSFLKTNCLFSLTFTLRESSACTNQSNFAKLRKWASEIPKMDDPHFQQKIEQLSAEYTIIIESNIMSYLQLMLQNDPEILSSPLSVIGVIHFLSLCYSNLDPHRKITPCSTISYFLDLNITSESLLRDKRLFCATFKHRSSNHK